MFQNQFNFAVSSLSCAATNIFYPHQIVLPSYATTATINRIIQMRTALGHIITPAEFEISLHVGYLLDTHHALTELNKHSIKISSIDTPDVRALSTFCIEITRNLHHLNLKRLKNTIGWQFASVTNSKSYLNKISEGIEGIPITHTSPFLIRTATSSWHNSGIGDTLIHLLKQKREEFPSLALALEIDARYQTPEDYFEFVLKLNEMYPEIPTFFDLDVGHIAEARIIHHDKNIQDPETYVEKLLNNKRYSKLIGMVSLNQYDIDKNETHISLFKGSIDYVKILKLLGQAGRAGNLSINPTIMAEFSPFEFDAMISPKGIDYFQSLKKAYLAE